MSSSNRPPVEFDKAAREVLRRCIDEELNTKETNGQVIVANEAAHEFTIEIRDTYEVEAAHHFLRWLSEYESESNRLPMPEALAEFYNSEYDSPMLTTIRHAAETTLQHRVLDDMETVGLKEEV